MVSLAWRSCFGVLVALLASAALISAQAGSDSNVSANVTFHKDVEPIIQKDCQSCHRPGQIGPMSLMDYRQVRPWARAIRDKVLKREMPPWFADPAHGSFANDRSLSREEIETIAKWVDAGAPEGDPREAPPAVQWPAEGWAIPPDVVVKGGVYRVPKEGVLDWVYVTMPLPFTEDTWVSSMEMRPGANPKLLHHYCIFIVPRRQGIQYGEFTVTSQEDASGGAPFEGCYEKGQEPFDYRAYGAARLIPANSDVIFQMHYAPTGIEADDQPQLGFTVAKERPAKQFVFMNMGAGMHIQIAPHQKDYQAPDQEGVLMVDAEIVWLQAHAHYRAKEFTFDITAPGKSTERVLKVRWDPNWQGLYYPVQPLIAPKGTVLLNRGAYDNSSENKFNPDPSKPVRFGLQAQDEMMFMTYGLLIDGSLDAQKIRLAVPSPRADQTFSIVGTSVNQASR